MNAGFISDVGPPWWLMIMGGGPLFALGAAWFFMAAILVFRGNDVDKPNRMAQFYGYSVCLIALIVGLVSATSMIDAAFDRANPLQLEAGFGASLVSFESYKATYRREEAMFDRSGTARPDTVSDATQRRQYDALVRDRVITTRYRTSKSLVTGTIFLLVSGVLFLFHWNWVRRLDAKAAA